MQWTKQRAWEWYDAHPWFRGCNYMSADCANRVDQWQSLGFEERMETVEEELALMEELGFNCVRLIVEYVVWKEEHDGFLERFDRYLEACRRHGISCMITLANDCMPPKGDGWKLPQLGEQHYDWGYHGGRKRSQHSVCKEMSPHFYLDDEESADDYFRMVTELVTRYKDDERVCMWDVYNEPGNRRRAPIALPILKRMFMTVRACKPSQPLTCAAWSWSWSEKYVMPEVERYALEQSDIVSYHFYGNYNDHVRVIKELKKLGRPIVNTEWLARCFGNDVFSLFPLFYLEKIGCFNWGFVAGKYQTYEPWESMWQNYYSGARPDIDFTKWFHDLYRPNHRPYDPHEVELIRKFCTLADEEFQKEQE